jgi:hypothetical protein
VILLVTNRDDLTADWLIVELQRRSAPYVRFNTEDFPEHCAIRLRPDCATLQIRDVQLAAEEIEAVWYRRPVPPRPRPGLRPDEHAWAVQESAVALDGFWRALPARWVSRPDAIRHADSKPQQLSDAARLGFEVPDTEITNERDHVRRLFDRNPAGVICKPLRDGRVRSEGRSLLFTSAISREDLKRPLEEPHVFQALVPKRYDVRVTVIGSDVFAVRITVDDEADGSTDWRRADPSQLRYRHEELPPDIRDLCRRLIDGYGLSFGAIDLARRPDGGYTFFELNPNGQWAFVEQRAGVPLRARLADLLVDGA